MTMSIGASGSSGWAVTSTQEQTIAQPGGGLLTGYKVSFQTGLGNVGSVFVSKAQFTPQSVAAAVTVEAAKLDQINTLSATAG